VRNEIVSKDRGFIYLGNFYKNIFMPNNNPNKQRKLLLENSQELPKKKALTKESKRDS